MRIIGELVCRKQSNDGMPYFQRIHIIYDEQTEKCIEQIYDKKHNFALEHRVTPELLMLGTQQYKHLIAYASRDTPGRLLHPEEFLSMEIIVLPVENYLEVTMKNQTEVLGLV